jgi:hypothetical protein
MSEFLLKLGSDLGHIYFLFVLALFVSNSIALHIKDEGGEGETRLIVGIVSGIIVVIAAFLGGEILKLSYILLQFLECFRSLENLLKRFICGYFSCFMIGS